MQPANDPAPEASVYAPGEVLTREVTVREFVLDHAPEIAELFTDADEAYAEIEAAAHAEARRLGLPVSPGGVYPLIVWDVAWNNLESHEGRSF